MLTIRCHVRWNWKFSRSSGSRMPEGPGEEQTAVVAGKCRQRCKCIVPTNTAKPCVPYSCWLSTHLHCSTPDTFVHRQRVVLGKETVSLSATNTCISSDIRKRVCVVQHLLNYSTAASSCVNLFGLLSIYRSF